MIDQPPALTQIPNSILQSVPPDRDHRARHRGAIQGALGLGEGYMEGAVMSPNTPPQKSPRIQI